MKAVKAWGTATLALMVLTVVIALIWPGTIVPWVICVAWLFTFFKTLRAYDRVVIGGRR